MKKKHFQFNYKINCSKPSNCHEAILTKLKPILNYENFSCHMTHEKNHVIDIDIYLENEGISKKPAVIPTENQIKNLLEK